MRSPDESKSAISAATEPIGVLESAFPVPLSEVDEKCDKFLKETFPTFQKIVPLFRALQRRWPKKKYPAADMRKEFTMLDLLLDTIGGGAGADVLKSYAFHSTRSTSIGVSEIDNQVMENIREMLLDLRFNFFDF